MNSTRGDAVNRTRRWAGVLAIGICGVLAAACTSHSSSASRTSAAAHRVDAAALAARIRTGLRGLSSAHISADTGVLAGTVSGDYEYRDGTATAYRITLGSGANPGEIITVGARSWARPPDVPSSGKPWLPVSPNSSNAFVRNATPVLTVAGAAGSLPALADIVATASSVTDAGSRDGGQEHEYRMDVDPSQAPGSNLTSLLAQLGEQRIPVTVDLDQHDRPVHLVLTVSLGAAGYRFTIEVSRFNAPLQISPPPAAQVGGS